jgi:hypothetical protein
MQLYVDMDGVLANFDWYHHSVVGDLSDKLLDNADWDAVEIYKIFYATIPPMADLPPALGSD